MHILIDTNVLISSLMFGGIPKRAVTLAQQYGTLIHSNYVEAEYNRVLQTPKFNCSKDHIQSSYEDIFHHAIHINPTEIVAVCRDHKDDPILASAIAGKAEIIVTGDQDLLTLHPYESIAILTPNTFITLFDAN